jgi:NADH dehydrogenase
LTALEWATTTRDPSLRRELLTFVVAGGGFSGVECMAAIEDLLHGALHYYPDLSPHDMKFMLVTLDPRLLPEVDKRLGAYVAEKFRKRQIDVRLGVGICAVTERSVTLTSGEVIPTRTAIWTGGIKVNPLLQSIDLPKDQRGALRVSGHLQVIDHPTIFALGDCAAVPRPDGHGFYTSTAQNALREGPVAAENIAALIRGSSALTTFKYRPIGSLASLGQRQAIAEIGGLRLSGLLAWFAWRTIYLAKMPTLANKTRIGLDWIKELITPVDTVQLPITRESVDGVMARHSVSAADAAPTAQMVSPPSA